MTSNDYDAMAAAYNADNEHNAWNAYYERPAILALAGDVRGQHVLDAGCGAGVHAAALVEKGARVSGFDLSQQLLDIARKRLGPDVPLMQADLSRPLPFGDGQFDMVLCALAMHYVEDWSAPLREFKRLLRHGGKLVFSTHHPFMDHQLAKGDSYFATYAFDDSWERDGKTISMRFWHRPLTAMLTALADAGFEVAQVQEPMPLPEAREKFPNEYKVLTTSPRFIFFSARKP